MIVAAHKACPTAIFCNNGHDSEDAVLNNCCLAGITLFVNCLNRDEFIPFQGSHKEVQATQLGLIRKNQVQQKLPKVRMSKGFLYATIVKTKCSKKKTTATGITTCEIPFHVAYSMNKEQV